MSALQTILTRPARSIAIPRLHLAHHIPRPGRQHRYKSSSSSSTKDPSHPYLHYHPQPSGSLSLSFLSVPPTSPSSRTVLGQIPPGAEGPGDFAENKEFVKVLHESIRDGLDKGKGEAAEFEAQGRPGDGYIHITGMFWSSI